MALLCGRIVEWRRLPVSLTELSINISLNCGQSFRWRNYQPHEWSCSLHGRIIHLRQDSDHLHYRAIFPDPSDASPVATPPEPHLSTEWGESGSGDDTAELLQHYFNLKPNLQSLYSKWASVDDNFRKRAHNLAGIRILRQDAWEALVGFICSSNNNIARISQMMEKLCKHFGKYLGRVDGHDYHEFPSPKDLAHSNVEQKLRHLGFGYRAKYIYHTAKVISEEKPTAWLENLSNPEYPEFGRAARPGAAMEPDGRPGYRLAHAELMELQGVGPKVADCVCLMGLGWREAVPVDTHVWQIAQRDYKFGRGKHRSLTREIYNAIGHRFRELWGEEAGWAHSILFTADLKTFAERPVDGTEQISRLLTVKTELDDDAVLKREGLDIPVGKSKRREVVDVTESSLTTQQQVITRVRKRRRL